MALRYAIFAIIISDELYCPFIIDINDGIDIAIALMEPCTRVPLWGKAARQQKRRRCNMLALWIRTETLSPFGEVLSNRRKRCQYLARTGGDTISKHFDRFYSEILTLSLSQHIWQQFM